VIRPAPPPAVDRSAAPPGTPPEAPGARAWYADPISLGLLGGGLIVTGVGGGFLLAAQSASRDSKSAEKEHKNYQDAETLKHTAERRGLIGAISAGAGVALLGAGVVRIVMHRGSSERSAVAGWLAPGGGGLAISGRF
jgi:hypothetical protein